MKRKVLSILLAGAMVMSMAACGGQETGQSSVAGSTASKTENSQSGGTTSSTGDTNTASELTDGKFAETRHITVEVYDRGNDGGSDPTNNMYTEYIWRTTT